MWRRLSTLVGMLEGTLRKVGGLWGAQLRPLCAWGRSFSMLLGISGR